MITITNCQVDDINSKYHRIMLVFKKWQLPQHFAVYTTLQRSWPITPFSLVSFCDLFAARILYRREQDTHKSFLYKSTCTRFYTGWPKRFGTIFSVHLNFTKNRFQKLFHCQNQEKICNNTIAKDPTTPQVCRYTTSWNVSVIKHKAFRLSCEHGMTTHLEKREVREIRNSRGKLWFACGVLPQL